MVLKGPITSFETTFLIDLNFTKANHQCAFTYGEAASRVANKLDLEVLSSRNGDLHAIENNYSTRLLPMLEDD